MLANPNAKTLLAFENESPILQETSAEQQKSAIAPHLDIKVAGEPVRLHCHDNLAAIECLWREFQKTASTSAYSSFQWCDAWLKTVGERLRVKPQVIVGYDARGILVFILPLQSRKHFGLNVLEFLGAPDMQCSYGLFNKAFLPKAADWFSNNLQQVLALAGKYDVISLLDMPHSFDGFDHPFSRSFTVTCANDSYSLTLAKDFESVYQRKRNSETRRANRRKDGRLAELGKLTFSEPQSEEELRSAISVMLEHKVRRLAENGIHGVFDADEHRMIHLLAEADENGAKLFTTHVLKLDDDVLAVTFGGWMNQTYWFYISSLAPDSAATKHSPGDFALRQTISACCSAGLQTFDFGAGAAPYKQGWTDSITHLQGIVLSNTMAGLPWALATYAKLNLTAVIKRSPMLRSLAFELRRMLRGSKA